MFTWTKEYSVGIKLIDEQHKKIFEIGSRLESIICDFDGTNVFEQLNDTYNELIDYTAYHFHSEEKLLFEANYTGIVEHVEKHKAFIHKLECMDLDLMFNRQGALAFDLLETVASWIFTHIKGDDFLYRNDIERYLEKQND